MNWLTTQRFVVVTGKGGVGRTTVSAAIALAAAKRGKRVCIAELYGQSSVARLFGLPGRQYAPRAVAPGVDTMSITPLEAIDDFGHRKVRLDMLLRVVLRSRVVSAFLDAVPGLYDLVQLGKVENLLMEPLSGDPRYDLMVIDAPATGHGLTLLSAARTMQEMARIGPFHDLAAIIERAFGNPALTALVLVTLPEELPVAETLELAAALGEDRPAIRCAVANQVRPEPFPAEVSPEALHAALERSAEPDVRRLGELAQRVTDRHQAQQIALTRLATGLTDAAGHPVPVARLPHVSRAADASHLQALAAALLAGATP